VEPVPVFAAEPHMQAVYARFHQQLALLPGEARQYGSHLVKKLLPPQWALEWYLPQWLGESLGVAATQTAALVLGNVYGLCHVALCDALIDEAKPADVRAPALVLNSALAHWWLAIYADCLGGDAWFWQRHGFIMQEWWRAAMVSNRYPAQNFDDYIQHNSSELAHRASPLKICCVAACRLGGQEERLPHFEAALDHLHVARVLMDHAQDWREDSEAGRYNAFVHYAAGADTGFSPPENRGLLLENSERAVYAELWFGRHAAPYFEKIAQSLAAAAVDAERTGCIALQHQIAGEQMRYARYREQLVDTAQRFLRQATAALFAGL